MTNHVIIIYTQWPITNQHLFKLTNHRSLLYIHNNHWIIFYTQWPITNHNLFITINDWSPFIHDSQSWITIYSKWPITDRCLNTTNRSLIAIYLHWLITDQRCSQQPIAVHHFFHPPRLVQKIVVYYVFMCKWSLRFHEHAN